MCAIFGLIDYGKVFTAAQRECFMNVLATECEIRGTDATGFAFNSGGKLRIYKRPVAAHEISLKLSEDANVIFGHTEWQRRGIAKRITTIIRSTERLKMPNLHSPTTALFTTISSSKTK